MGYLEKNVVAQNEKILIKPERNKIPVVAAWIIGILFFWLLFIPLIWAIRIQIEFKTTEFLVTDKRVMEKYGWLSTHTDEMQLSKIENVTVYYSIFGKMFNYGRVCFQGANMNNVTFTYIKNAEDLKKRFNEII